MARAVLVGVPHHLTQRGVDRGRIFFTDRDCEVYLELLRANAKRHALTVLGYCLMVNHVHLVASPQGADSLARAIGKAHCQYAAYANAKLSRTGHFWQNRFFSCALEECHLWAALRYVERNPVRAGLVSQAAEWPWSSARAHAMGTADPLVSEGLVGGRFAREEWAVMLEAGTMDDAEIRLRSHTYTGRPVGSSEFIAAAEAALKRRLARQRGGRPRGQPDERQMILPVWGGE